MSQTLGTSRGIRSCIFQTLLADPSLVYHGDLEGKKKSKKHTEFYILLYLFADNHNMILQIDQNSVVTNQTGMKEGLAC